ncbi:MAG TPA: MarR family winged helix-turn-helix transcriptional regulator [Gemmatirosa sp.]
MADPDLVALKLVFAADVISGAYAAAAAACGLTSQQAQVLSAIAPGAPRKVRDLAAELTCDPGNLSGVLDRLEDAGLVARRPSPVDKRVRLIGLTPEGEARRARLEDATRAHAVHRRLAALPPDARAALLTLLGRVTEG